MSCDELSEKSSLPRLARPQMVGRGRKAATLKELIHEEFGDGIMSAIDFEMDLMREPAPKGDRVKIVMSGSSFLTRHPDQPTEEHLST